MKKIITALVLGSSLFATAAASAAPVTLNGETAIKFNREKEDDSAHSGTAYTLKLMAETKLNDNLSAYARLGAQNVGKNLVGVDFNTDAYSDKTSVIAIDQFGLILEEGNLTYKLGRQDAAVGTTALLYGRLDSNIGKDSFVDGLSVAGTIGVTDISALLAREDNTTGGNNYVYALRTGYNLSGDTNVGLTLGRFDNSAGPSTNHWAIDGTYNYGRNSWTAEFGKSNSNTDNTALAVVWNYDRNDKTAFSVTGFRVEANGAMGEQSDFGSNLRGVHYAISHSIKDNTAFEFVFKDEKDLGDSPKKYKTYEATLSYTF